MDKKEYFDLIEELFHKKREIIDWDGVSEQIDDFSFVENIFPNIHSTFTHLLEIKI